MNTPIMRAGARVLAAFLVLFSLFMLARGHNAPGGGFIAGLVAASAVGLLTLALGAQAARRALRVPPETIAAAGLAIALGAGLFSGLAAEAPFTGLWLLLGAENGGKGLPLSNILLFDAGVWLVVLGATAALILALSETS
jgi:multicomponent Na+:H+ antiporter subunit B